MNAHALQLPEGRGLSRWSVAVLTILFAHAALVTGVAFWYARRPPTEPNIIPAIITVTLAPVDASSPEIQDLAVEPARETAPSMMPNGTCRNPDFDQSLNINSGQ